MKLIDMKVATIGYNTLVRLITDEGLEGYGQIERNSSYTKPQLLFYQQHIAGEDPTNVERVMMKIRRLGAFKPWGSAVSAIEMAMREHISSGRWALAKIAAKREATA